MLPIAIQIAHAFEKHEYSVSSKQINYNLYENETDCSVFHFKINHNSFDYSANFLLEKKVFINEKIYSTESLSFSVKPPLKTSRGPPYFMLSN